jgi:SCY1-like protein 2
LPTILPVLDFSTIKNELFPVIASVFSKTSSLGIKVRGLEAFVILCGGSLNFETDNDGLDGMMNASGKKKSTSSALDKYTMQEKIVPLLRAIKTKESAVMLAALRVLKQVGKEADTDFIAMDILPILWSMSLGPLLDLKQFQSFMDLIKSLSSKVESEHTKKLQELSGSTVQSAKNNDDFMSFGGISTAFPASYSGGDSPEVDFERLVTGKVSSTSQQNNSLADGGWDAPQKSTPAVSPAAPTFSWSTPAAPATQSSMSNIMKPQQATAARTITPDLSKFDALTPSSTQFSQPLQPSHAFSQPALQPQQVPPNQTSPGWNPPNTWGSQQFISSPPALIPSNQSSNSAFSSASLSMNSMNSTMGNLTLLQQQQKPPLKSSTSAFSLPPPPSWGSQALQPQVRQTQQQVPQYGQSQQPPRYGQGLQGSFSDFQQSQIIAPLPQQPQSKKGLDAYESLL